MPPVAPMLAKPVPDLPEGPWSFEPKWDGFRTIVFCHGDEVELGSRKERPMTRYFPEVVEVSRRSGPSFRPAGWRPGPTGPGGADTPRGRWCRPGSSRPRMGS